MYIFIGSISTISLMIKSFSLFIFVRNDYKSNVLSTLSDMKKSIR